MDERHAVPLWEAADGLGLQIAEVVDLILAGRVHALRRPNGRPFVDPADVARSMTEEPGTSVPS